MGDIRPKVTTSAEGTGLASLNAAVRSRSWETLSIDNEGARRPG
jgi:hypothetical protein